MKKVGKVLFCLCMGILLMSGFAMAEQDMKGCKDHPLFTRMPDFYISNCSNKEFDAHEFFDPATKQKLSVEGRTYWYEYDVQRALRDRKSQVQISRNYANAITKIGGTAYQYNDGETYLKLVKDGKEIWANISQDNWGGNTYYLYIVEKQAMEQEVVADAKTMAQDINTTGKATLYGIYFDFNKADVKPESTATLKEIAKLLAQNPKLKLIVVGHTDNVGGLDHNMKLSQARADAVAKVLTSQFKVDPSRLRAFGVGFLAPVNSNDTEDGRAKNRRVELVKQ